ncbi:MAG TPA: helix-turn-helix domain-containing protein [Ideonella sp.]|nr:helix-turn-helix domain-containing protein [Ideonella sp.]
MSAATVSPGDAPFGHRRCGDVDDQAALLRGWNQDYAQMSAGAFAGEISDIWLQDLHLFTETTGRRLRQRGALPGSRFALGLPLAMGEGPVVFCGASDWGGPQAGERFCTFSGTPGFEFFTPEGLVMAGVEFDWTELLALADASEQAVLRPLSLGARLHSAPTPVLSALREMLQAGFSLSRSRPELLADPVGASALRKSVLSNVIELLLSSQQQPGPEPTPERAWKLVARAQAHLRQDPETPHTVADLCQAVGASRRTLQNAFQRVLDMPPHDFLRALRLAGARRSLRSARSVAEAATRWGFWHLGLFAQDYKRQFGELPSVTWRRHRHAPPWAANGLH